MVLQIIVVGWCVVFCMGASVVQGAAFIHVKGCCPHEGMRTLETMELNAEPSTPVPT